MRHVGYWRKNIDDVASGLPWPEANVLTDAEVIEALGTLSVLENTETTNVVHYRGWSTCRLCGCHNGSREFEYQLPNGTVLAWPEGLKHYIAEHRVPLPKEIKEIADFG